MPKPSFPSNRHNRNFEAIKAKTLAIVAAIPENRVTTYGSIAKVLRVSPRQVARVMSTLTADEAEGLPWFRVVAANGVISSLKRGGVGRRQIDRLRNEGIAVSPRNKVMDFAAVLWLPIADRKIK
ncbi:MAG TPA: MGMT family protein [Urbifossiella sp.]